MYVLATTDKIVRWYCVARDWSSFELLDQLDLNRIVGYHDKATARAVAQAYLDSRARLGFPMAPREWAGEVLAKLEEQNAKKAA